MGTTDLNVVIVAENALIVNGLKHYLRGRFGSSVNINCFYDFKSCLKNLKSDTDVVVVDFFIDGKKGADVLRSVKLINPHTEGVIHTSDEEVAEFIQKLMVGLPKASGEGPLFAFN
jgi:DNA-binding NarL/FixJ family response regulator